MFYYFHLNLIPGKTVADVAFLMTVILFLFLKNLSYYFYLFLVLLLFFSLTRVMGRIYPVTDKLKLFEEWLNFVVSESNGVSTNEDWREIMFLKFGWIFNAATVELKVIEIIAYFC